MSGELKAGMTRLAEIAPRLDRQTNEVSRLVVTVEKLLTQEARIGISARVTFEEEEGYSDVQLRRTSVVRFLAFGRVGGVFRIHILEETGALDDDGDWDYLIDKTATLWPSCDRETKLKAFGKLPELLDSIVKEADRLSLVAEKAATKVEEISGFATASA